MFCVCRMRREGLSRSSSSFPLPSFLRSSFDALSRNRCALRSCSHVCSNENESVSRSTPSLLLPFPTLHREGFFPLGMVQLWNNEASNSGVGLVFGLGGMIGMAVVFRRGCGVARAGGIPAISWGERTRQPECSANPIP